MMNVYADEEKVKKIADHYGIKNQLRQLAEECSELSVESSHSARKGTTVKIIEEMAERTQIIETGVEELVNARKVANKIEDEHQKAIAYHDTVAPKMEEIRYQIDKLELIVADELWTLPKYRELLFIR